MKKIILGAIVLFSMMSCTKEEVDEIPQQSYIEKISDRSVKEGYLGTIIEANKIVDRGQRVDLVPLGIKISSMVFLVYVDDNIFLTFSDWGSPEQGSPFYTQGDYIVTKVEKGKVYFVYQHKIGDKWVDCVHHLDLSNGLDDAYLGGDYGSVKRNGNHPTGVFDPNDYFIDFYEK